jgi:hypothetical protein
VDLRPESGDLLPYGDDLLAATIDITDRHFRRPITRSRKVGTS